MTYVSIAQSTTVRAENAIQQECVHGIGTSFFVRHIPSRLGHLFLAPFSVVSSALDTLIGIIAGVGSLLTFGAIKSLDKFTFNHLGSSRQILSCPYANLLRVINPRASFQGTDRSDKYGGLLTAVFQGALHSAAKECTRSNNALKKYVFSRAIYLTAAVVSLMTRVIDLVIGVFAMALSFLTFGTSKRINAVAYDGLQITGIIQDLFLNVTKMLNPF